MARGLGSTVDHSLNGIKKQQTKKQTNKQTNKQTHKHTHTKQQTNKQLHGKTVFAGQKRAKQGKLRCVSERRGGQW
jgi:hypothetical protein